MHSLQLEKINVVEDGSEENRLNVAEREDMWETFYRMWNLNQKKIKA